MIGSRFPFYFLYEVRWSYYVGESALVAYHCCNEISHAFVRIS